MREDAQQRATEFVKELYAAGEIDADRFSTGVAGVLAARSEAELAEVVRSLPAPVALTSQERRLAEPLEIHSGLGRLRLAGRWQVASQTHISADLGSIRLDLTEAEFDDHLIDLHVYTGWGSITIIVPTGVGVQVVGEQSGEDVRPPHLAPVLVAQNRAPQRPAVDTDGEHHREGPIRPAAGPARRDHQYRQSSPAPPGNPGPHQTLARRQKAPITGCVHRPPQNAAATQRPADRH